METAQNPAWRHHHLPQFCLRKFADPTGKVWWTRRRPDGTLQEEHSIPKETGYEAHLYSLWPQNAYDPAPTSDAIEKRVFGDIDDRGANALRALLKNRPSALSARQRRDWAIFVNSLIERAPGRLRERDGAARQLAEEHRDRFLTDRSDTDENRERWTKVLRNLDANATAENAVRQLMVREIGDPRVIEYFTKVTWIKFSVAENPEMQFITGDSPVVINVGTDGPIHLMSIALTPHDLLFMCQRDDVPESLLAEIAVLHDLLVLGQSTTAYSRAPLRDGMLVKTRRAAQISMKPFKEIADRSQGRLGGLAGLRAESSNE